MAEYKPSRVALEQEAPTKTLLTPLPKVFGLTPTVQATVSLNINTGCGFLNNTDITPSIYRNY